MTKGANISQIIKRTNHEEKKKNPTAKRSATSAEKRIPHYLHFRHPKLGNKHQFLERDMLNTLAVGCSLTKRLCEILLDTLRTACSLLPFTAEEDWKPQEESAGLALIALRKHR